MLTESDILPFSTNTLPVGPWLIFSPHPDDETFGMGGSLLLAKEKNIEVSLITVTNGQMGGDDVEHSIIIDNRKNELNNAAQFLGIKQLFFLEMDDRHIIVDEPIIKKVQAIISSESPATIFFPSVLEPHPDHRATAQLIARSVTPAMHSIAFYSYDISVQNPINTLIDISSVQSQKNQAMQMYPSQLAQNNYSDVVNSLNKSRTYTLPSSVDYAEGFFYYKDFIHQPLADQIYQQLQSFWLSQQPVIVPMISVIVRTYNRESLLKGALESLTQQSHSNIEVIVVNDGGKDVSHLVNRFTAEFSKIIYCSLDKNQGRSAAANKGLETATGDYLLFLDDDDYILPEHLSILVKNLADHPKYQAAYTDTRIKSPEGDCTMSEPYDISLLRQGNFLPIHSVLFRRSLLDYVSFDTSLSVYEDWDFWLQVAQHSDFLHIDNHATAIYSAQGNSGVGIITSRDKQRQEKFKVVDKWYDSWDSDTLVDIFYALEDKKDRDLKEHQAVIQENAHRLEWQRTEIENLTAEKQALSDINSQLHSNLMDKDKKIEQLQGELRLLFSSISWRVSKPLRMVKQWLSLGLSFGAKKQ